MEFIIYKLLFIYYVMLLNLELIYVHRVYVLQDAWIIKTMFVRSLVSVIMEHSPLISSFDTKWSRNHEWQFECCENLSLEQNTNVSGICCVCQNYKLDGVDSTSNGHKFVIILHTAGPEYAAWLCTKPTRVTA